MHLKDNIQRMSLSFADLGDTLKQEVEVLRTMEDPCQQASDLCGQGDQEACNYDRAYCTPDDGDEDCQRASNLCAQGDQHACELYDYYCEGNNPPVDECTGANDACYVGDFAACDFYEAYCGGSASSCDQLYADCHDNANQDACFAYESQCTVGGTDGGVDPTCHYDRICEPGGCDELGDCWDETCWDEQVCDGGGSVEPSPCDKLYLDCHDNANQDACFAYDSQCTSAADGGAPSSEPSCHYETFCKPGCDGPVCWQECWDEYVCDQPPPPFGADAGAPRL